MPQKRNRRKADSMALALLGTAPGKRMETPEQRILLCEILAQSDKPQMQALARDGMNTISFAKTSMMRLAESQGVTLHMLSREITDLMRSEGLMKAAMRLPIILEQVADDATGRDVKCKYCHGSGQIKRIIKGKEDEEDTEEFDPCVKCDSKGTVYKMGDAERLRMIFETFGLTGKSGGLNVNLDLRKVESHESMADLSASIAGIIEGEEP